MHELYNFYSYLISSIIYLINYILYI